MRSLLPALALLLPLSTVLAADAPLSPLVIGPGVAAQAEPALAVNGDARFVIWTDYRARDAGVQPLLLGSRVDAEGTLLDPLGIVISAGSRGHIGTYYRAPEARPERDGFLVRWEEGSVSMERHIASDGTPLGEAVAAPPVPRLGLPGLNGEMRSATDGETVLWIARPTLADSRPLYIVRTTRSGEVLNGPALFTGAPGGIVDFLWDGQRYVLIATANDTTYAVRFDRTGAPTGTMIPLLSTPFSWAIDTATRGDGSLAVVYMTGAQDTNIEGVIFHGDTVTRVTIAATPMSEQMPDIAPTADGYISAWAAFAPDFHSGGLQVVPLTAGLEPAAALAPEEETRSVTEQRRPNVNRTSTALLAVWSEQDGNGLPRIMGRHLPGAPESAAALWPHGAGQYAPAVAGIGPTHLVVWYEGAFAGAKTLKALRVDAFGDALDVEPLTVGPALWKGEWDIGNADAPPSVVWSGRYFLILYRQGLILRLARVTAGGVLISDEPLPPAVRKPQNKPVLVRAGRMTFAVWQEGELRYDCIITCIGPTPGIIRGTRLSEAGELLDRAPFDIATDDFSTLPDAAWDGRSLLVTWTAEDDVYAQAFDHNGIPYQRYNLGPGDRPAAAGRNGEVLVTFESTERNVTGVTFRHGFPDAPFTVGEGTRDKQRPRPFLTEDGFGVLYERRSFVMPVLGVSRAWMTIPAAESPTN